MEEADVVDDVRGDALPQRERLADDVFLARHVLGAGEQRRAGQERLADFRRQHFLRFGEIAVGDPQPRGPVDIGWADAATRRADRRAAALLLAEPVERRVVRKDDVRARRDRDA